VNPLALEALARMKFPTEGFRSKSWDEFAVPGAPPLSSTASSTMPRSSASKARAIADARPSSPRRPQL